MVTQLALGMRAMLFDAVDRHRREFQDELPRCIRMHPAVFCEWVSAMPQEEWNELVMTPNLKRYWRGILIEQRMHVKGVDMINANNVIEPI